MSLVLNLLSSGEQRISHHFSFFFLFFNLNPLCIFCVQISVKNMDDKPLANRIVVLEVNGEYHANYTTDKNGIAAFSINTSEFFDPSFKLRVSISPSLIPEKILHQREELEANSGYWQNCFR